MTGKTYFGSALKAGSDPSENSDPGHVTLVQHVTMQAAGNATENASLKIPADAEILDIVFDTTVAHTAATFAVSAGITAGGTEYASAVNVKAAGRVRPTFTGAQLAAMADVNANTTVYFQGAAGTPTTVGTTTLSLHYRMRADTDA